MTTGPGRVDLVGAGPGAPELITVRGANLLRQAEVVVYDQLVHERLLGLAPAGAERIFAGKRRGRLVFPQSEMNALLVDRARAGKRVVRLKGGDPLVFGRGMEEAAFLRLHGVPYSIVPGVTAAVGVSAYAELPLTHRDAASAVAFITGHDTPGDPASRLDWNALARFPGTLVFYMGVAHMRALAEALLAEGKNPETPAAVVERGSWPRQRSLVSTLAGVALVAETAGVCAPALLVVGPAVQLRSEPSWFEALPLFGQTIVLTRPSDDAAETAAELERLGAEVLLAPMVEIEPLSDFTQLDRALGRLRAFDWLVFTSRHGVDAFFQRAAQRGLDARSLGHAQIAAIGPGTAEQLLRWNLRADVVPSRFDSEGLVEALREQAAGKSILLARANRGRTVLQDALGQVAQVEQVAVYRNVDAESLPEPVREALAAGKVDWITLSSSAIAERFHKLAGPGLCGANGREARLASISPITSQTAERLGWHVAAEAREATWPALIDCMSRFAEPPRRD